MKHLTSPAISATPVRPDAEFVLGSIRSGIIRVDQIRQEMINAGLALKAGHISPQMALDWCEEFAPGCVGYIPPGSGLVTPAKERVVA